VVPEKNEDVQHNFNSDPIRLRREGEWLMACGTTLGADNGIGGWGVLGVLRRHSRQRMAEGRRVAAAAGSFAVSQP
jgi:di/tripeptidase